MSNPKPQIKDLEPSKKYVDVYRVKGFCCPKDKHQTAVSSEEGLFARFYHCACGVPVDQFIPTSRFVWRQE